MSINVSNTNLNKLYEWVLTPCFELLNQILFHFVTCFYPEKLITYVKNIIMEKTKKELQWRTCWKTLGEARERWVVVLQICESNIRNTTKKKNAHTLGWGRELLFLGSHEFFVWLILILFCLLEDCLCFVCWRIDWVCFVYWRIDYLCFVCWRIDCLCFGCCCDGG